jgi:hypothetical protein
MICIDDASIKAGVDRSHELSCRYLRSTATQEIPNSCYLATYIPSREYFPSLTLYRDSSLSNKYVSERYGTTPPFAMHVCI